MEIRRVVYSLLNKWWLIAFLLILCGGIGYYLNIFLSMPMYSADVTLIALNKDKVDTGQSLSPQDLTLSQGLITQYAGIFRSRAVIDAATQRLSNYNISSSMLYSMVTVSSEVDSNLLTIHVTASDPEIAVAAANAMGDSAASVIRNITKKDYIGILDRAQMPTEPIASNGIKKTFLWVLAGLIVSIGIVYLMEYIDSSVRSTKQIEEELNLKVLGIIPEHNIR